LRTKKGYRRGYPVAVLVGLEEDEAVLWRIFSVVVKSEKTIDLDGTRRDSKALYNFHESIINALRPALKEGVGSIMVASPARTDFAKAFIDHLRAHHVWLTQSSSKTVFSEIIGSAGTMSEVAALTRTSVFREKIKETKSQETGDLIDVLEKHLTSSNENDIIAYSIDEAENLILNRTKHRKSKPEYLMLTDKYLSGSHEKNRLQRLMQIASNRNVKTRIVDSESNAGQRLTQIGGLVCLAHLE
jgi:stalled ribosome rescue protein Dom34